MMEIWKDIKGFEGFYMVSDKGRIKSLSLRWKYKNSVPKPDKILKLSIRKDKYHSIFLSNGVEKKQFLVHRLVANAFIENHENKAEVNHKNLNRSDNRVENLEWVTRNENIQHFYDCGIGKSGYITGIGNPKNRPIIQYSIDGDPIREWVSTREASRYFGINSNSITSVLSKRKGISRGYQWRYKSDNISKLPKYESKRGIKLWGIRKLTDHKINN